MKYFLAIVIFCIACNSNKNSTSNPFNSKDTSIDLKGVLGQIKLSVPNRYDTFFTWTQESDCSHCGTERYRFQSKKTPIFMETGWYWHDRKDSVDQLTIIHSQFIVIRDSVSKEYIKMQHNLALQELKTYPRMHNSTLQTDTIQYMNGRYFSIIASEKIDSVSKLYSKILWATTFVKNNKIEFKFELITDKNDQSTTNFIAESKYLLSRIL